jgi:hypothetical protein
MTRINKASGHVTPSAVHLQQLDFPQPRKLATQFCWIAQQLGNSFTRRKLPLICEFLDFRSDARDVFCSAEILRRITGWLAFEISRQNCGIRFKGRKSGEEIFNENQCYINSGWHNLRVLSKMKLCQWCTARFGQREPSSGVIIDRTVYWTWGCMYNCEISLKCWLNRTC